MQAERASLRTASDARGVPSAMAGPEVFTDDELTELALAGDPDTAVPCDAVPLGQLLGAGAGGELLPEWYMPAPMSGNRVLRGWRRCIVLLIVASFVLLNAYGLCSTYGDVGFD
jgi:hypothetical protein